MYSAVKKPAFPGEAVCIPACCSKVALPSSRPQAAPHRARRFLALAGGTCSPSSSGLPLRSREAKAITGSSAAQPM